MPGTPGHRSRCQSIGERIEGYDDEGEAGDSQADRQGERAEAQGVEGKEESGMTGYKAEYKVQMFRYGKWTIGHIPFCGHIQTTDSIEAARKLIDAAKAKWQQLDRPDHEKPTEWRILSRKVTEWKPEYHA